MLVCLDHSSEVTCSVMPRALMMVVDTNTLCKFIRQSHLSLFIINLSLFFSHAFSHACDLHGLPEPESHSEPIHEPHGHGHGYEHGYSASNSHATNSINSPSINSKIATQVKSTGSLLPSLASKESRLHITALRPLEKLTSSATEALEKAVKEYFRAWWRDNHLLPVPSPPLVLFHFICPLSRSVSVVSVDSDTLEYCSFLLNYSCSLGQSDKKMQN